MNTSVEWVALKLRIRKAPGTNLGMDSGYSDTFRRFSQSFR
jgi:hypothetical protein